MNQPYAAPQAELERRDVVLERPKRIAVDLTFWVAHLALGSAFYLLYSTVENVGSFGKFMLLTSVGLIAGIGVRATGGNFIPIAIAFGFWVLPNRNLTGSISDCVNGFVAHCLSPFG